MSGQTTIELDGKTYGVLFGAKAVFDLAKLKGVTVDQLSLPFDYENMSLIVYCGIACNAFRNRETFTLSLEDVEVLLSEKTLADLTPVFNTFAETLTGGSGADKKKASQAG